MYKLLIWPLLALVPVTGVRMVCIERSSATTRSAASLDGDCEQFCLRSNAPERDVRSATVECMLIAECSLLVGVSSVAVLPVQAPLEFEPAPRQYAIELPDGYLAPVLSHATPPPKA